MEFVCVSQDGKALIALSWNVKNIAQKMEGALYVSLLLFYTIKRMEHVFVTAAGREKIVRKKIPVIV